MVAFIFKLLEPLSLVELIFTFCTALLMDYGPNNNAYAGKTFFDPIRKERVWWSWSPEQVKISRASVDYSSFYFVSLVICYG